MCKAIFRIFEPLSFPLLPYPTYEHPLLSFFELLSVEDFQLVRADNHLNNLVFDDTSATKLVDKVNEVKNDKFATNAFVVLVKKGLDSSALQVYNEFENSIKDNTGIIKSVVKEDEAAKSQVENFVKTHGIHNVLD